MEYLVGGSLLMIAAYLCGSVCSAIIISKTFNLPDPRNEGSQNPGATNVLRLAGKKYAVITLFFDMLKGFLPVLVAKFMGFPPVSIAFICFAAVIGHMYPYFYQFKGGKGVATAMGVFLGFNLILGTAVIATWLLVANFSRYSSLASLVSMALAPFYALGIIQELTIMPPLLFITVFIFFKHRNNITRLFDGSEPKITLRSSSPEDGS